MSTIITSDNETQSRQGRVDLIQADKTIKPPQNCDTIQFLIAYSAYNGLQNRAFQPISGPMIESDC